MTAGMPMPMDTPAVAIAGTRLVPANAATASADFRSTRISLYLDFEELPREHDAIEHSLNSPQNHHRPAGKSHAFVESGREASFPPLRWKRTVRHFVPFG